MDHWDDGRDRGDPGERRDAVKQGLAARLVGVIELESGGLGGVRRAGSPESLSSSATLMRIYKMFMNILIRFKCLFGESS